MPVKVLDLGELQVTSKDSKQSLWLASSVTLDIPASIDEQISAAGLADLTSSGGLWIAKAATCRLEVAASVQGIEPHGADASTLPQYMVDAVSECTIWEDLTLKLRKEPSKTVTLDEAQPDAYSSFIVNHPDLSSNFLSPRDTPCAELLAITCDICYGTRPRRKCDRKPPKRRKTEEPAQSRSQGPYGLRYKPTPVKWVEYGDTDEEEDRYTQKQAGKRRGRGSTALRDRPDSEAQHTLQNTRQGGTRDQMQQPREDVALLIRAAFSKLLGTKKKTQGVRVVRDMPGPSLIDMAPAVFNIRYLQGFSSRAEHIPRIASCLSGLDAESPTLRAKIRSLAEGSTERDATSELEKRLHMLVQRGLNVPPIAPPRRRAKAKVSVPVDDLGGLSQQPDLSQQTLSQQTQDISQQPEDYPEQPEPALERDSPEYWGQDDGESWEQGATRTVSQQQFEADEDEPPSSWDSSQQIGSEWLDLSQATFIVDENGQPIAFEDLDHDEYSYELVPLADG